MNKIFVQVSVSILSFLLLFSCSDDKLEAGLELLPGSNQFEAGVDTLQIECYTFKGTPGFANGTSKNTLKYPIGHVFDEVFGETFADVSFEFSYTADNKYDKDPDDDDVVTHFRLYLNISNSVEETGAPTKFLDPEIYGDTSSVFHIDVYPLASRYSHIGSTISHIQSDYFDGFNSITSTNENSVIHQRIADKPGAPQLDTGMYIIVDLDSEIAENLLDTSLYESENIDKFYEILPGLLLQANKNSEEIGALTQFTPEKSKLVLEYERTGGSSTGDDTTQYLSYNISKFQCAYRNIHENKNAEIEGTFRDTINQDSVFYLQSLGGTKGIIKFNTLIDFKKQHQDSIGINLAELILPISLRDTSMFKLPQRIMIYGILPAYIKHIPDNSPLLNSVYFNGFLDKENLVYRVNLSEYLHQYMVEDLEYLLLDVSAAVPNSIPAESDFLTPSRAVLFTGSEENEEMNRPYIRIVYTKIYN